MKITILQKKLKDGIKVVERVSQRTPSLPILQNVLVKSKKNFLTLETTNLEIGIRWWALIKLTKEGEIVVPTKTLSNLINLLPEKPVDLEVENLNLLISCENYQTELKGFSSSEFPIIPYLKEGERIAVDGSIFCQALAQVVNIASPSVARPEVSGVYFSFQKDLIKMVATDSFRLGEKKLFVKSPLLQEYALILPQQTAREILTIFGEKSGDIQIYFSSNQILFESAMEEVDHPQVQLSSKLIEGEYPNYQEIIPTKSETRIVCSKQELLNHSKTARIFSGKANEIKFKIDPKEKKLHLLSQSPDLGEYKSFLPGKISGKEMQVSFNHRFLLEGVSEIKTPEVALELVGEDSPVLVKPTEREDYLYVVMPIKAS